MTTITIELPDDVFATLRRSPDELARDVRLTVAIQWYSQGTDAKRENYPPQTNGSGLFLFQVGATGHR
jgi:hypothetical protein